MMESIEIAVLIGQLRSSDGLVTAIDTALMHRAADTIEQLQEADRVLRLAVDEAMNRARDRADQLVEVARVVQRLEAAHAENHRHGMGCPVQEDSAALCPILQTILDLRAAIS